MSTMRKPQANTPAYLCSISWIIHCYSLMFSSLFFLRNTHEYLWECSICICHVFLEVNYDIFSLIRLQTVQSIIQCKYTWIVSTIQYNIVYYWFTIAKQRYIRHEQRKRKSDWLFIPKPKGFNQILQLCTVTLWEENENNRWKKITQTFDCGIGLTGSGCASRHFWYRS